MLQILLSYFGVPPIQKINYKRFQTIPGGNILEGLTAVPRSGNQGRTEERSAKDEQPLSLSSKAKMMNGRLPSEPEKELELRLLRSAKSLASFDQILSSRPSDPTTSPSAVRHWAGDAAAAAPALGGTKCARPNAPRSRPQRHLGPERENHNLWHSQGQIYVLLCIMFICGRGCLRQRCHAASIQLQHIMNVRS